MLTVTHGQRASRITPPAGAAQPIGLGLGDETLDDDPHNNIAAEDGDDDAREDAGDGPPVPPTLLGYARQRWPWLPYAAGGVLVLVAGSVALPALMGSRGAASSPVAPTAQVSLAGAPAAGASSCVVIGAVSVQYAPGQPDAERGLTVGQPCTVVGRAGQYPDLLRIDVGAPGQPNEVWYPASKLQLTGVAVAALPDMVPVAPTPAPSVPTAARVTVEVPVYVPVSAPAAAPEQPAAAPAAPEQPAVAEAAAAPANFPAPLPTSVSTCGDANPPLACRNAGGPVLSEPRGSACADPNPPLVCRNASDRQQP